MLSILMPNISRNWKTFAYIDKNIKVHKDEFACELHVDSLPFDSSVSELFGLFQTFGGIAEIRLNLSDNFNNGYGYIKLDHPIAAEQAATRLNGIQLRDGVKIRVILFRCQRRLVVTNIPMDQSEYDILKCLSPMVEGIKTITTKRPITKTLWHDWKLNTGFAFIEFTTHLYARKAVRMFKRPDILFWNRTINVEWMEPDFLYKHCTMSGIPYGLSEDRLLYLVQKASMNGLVGYSWFYGCINLEFASNYQAGLAIRSLNGLALNGGILKMEWNIFKK